VKTKAILRIPDRQDGSVWHLRKPAGIAPAPHHHDELELNLITRGSGRYLVDDQLYDLAPGTMLWLYRGQSHLLIDFSEDFVMWIAVFRTGMVQRVCRSDDAKALAADRPIGRFCKDLPDVDTERVESLCADLAAVPDTEYFNAGLPYLLRSAWRVFQTAEQLTTASDVHPAVERAARLINSNPEPVGLDEVARKAGLSPSRLSRLFKSQTGVSLVQYRQRRQLDRFFELYGVGQRRNMAQAALEAGFGSYAQFHRVFKQVMRESPADYRRRLRYDA